MTDPIPQIIALGGGGFSEEDTPALDRYILAQCGQAEPRVCFLGQASGDAPLYATRFYAAFTQLPCRPFHLSLFEPPTADLAGYLLGMDVLYVGGGNTKSMLALWREWGLPAILEQAWRSGIVLAGISAGAICWFQQGLTDSVPGALRPLDCLGLLPGSCSPHYDVEAARRPSFQALIAQGEMVPGYGVDNSAALHFHGPDLHQVVASRPEARAYRVEGPSTPGGEVRETVLPVTLLD
jgi:dipeptidase E